MGRAGQTDRFGARLRALLKREAEPDRGLARRACDQNLGGAIIALIPELVGDQPAGQEQRAEDGPNIMVGGTITFQRLDRSEEHTSELQSLMRISYAVFCLKKKNK